MGDECRKVWRNGVWRRGLRWVGDECKKGMEEWGVEEGFVMGGKRMQKGKGQG